MSLFHDTLVSFAERREIIMNIGYATVWGEAYTNNKLFDPSSCLIGQNLLEPGIQLKKAIERDGHFLQTADMFDINDIDVLICQDLSTNSWLTINSANKKISYLYLEKYKYDYLLKSLISKKKVKRILIMAEPEVVCPVSYNTQYHKYFDLILTWNDDLVGGKYKKFYYAQPRPSQSYEVSYDRKKFLVMISGNKSSTGPNELYSERRKAVDYCEQNDIDFDLYGIGWNNEQLHCYKGMVEDKLYVLSKYKFSFCFENMTNIKGYITEKIFDCFFAGVIPIYWGADNITDYIPSDTFIDFREFRNFDKLIKYISSIDENKYNSYIHAINRFLDSEGFKNKFSVDAYVNYMKNIILK